MIYLMQYLKFDQIFTKSSDHTKLISFRSYTPRTLAVKALSRILEPIFHLLRSDGLLRAAKGGALAPFTPCKIRTDHLGGLYRSHPAFRPHPMRFRPLLALVLAFCLTFVAAPSTVSASGERGNSRFADIVNTGKANDCPTIANDSGTINIGSGDTLNDICLHPTEIQVKVAATKRKKADFVPAKIISPSNNTTIEQVYGDISGSGTFTEQGGIDFQLITVLTPGGEEVPFVFSAKDLVATSNGSSITVGSEFKGEARTPSYRTSNFLDPKSRALTTGVDYAQGLVALGGDDDELDAENIKRYIDGKGQLTLSVDSVNSATEEFTGTFTAFQPSDTDMGGKQARDVKITGALYGRKG